MKIYFNILFKRIILASFVGSFGLSLLAQEVEEVVVTAEKRSESLQDISQAVTALTEEDIEEKNITSFVDLSAIVPGVTVAKNEGYKTVISIRTSLMSKGLRSCVVHKAHYLAKTQLGGQLMLLLKHLQLKEALVN